MLNVLAADKDKAIVLTAIKQSPDAIRHASDALRSQKDFLSGAQCQEAVQLHYLQST